MTALELLLLLYWGLDLGQTTPGRWLGLLLPVTPCPTAMDTSWVPSTWSQFISPSQQPVRQGQHCLWLVRLLSGRRDTLPKGPTLGLEPELSDSTAQTLRHCTALSQPALLFSLLCLADAVLGSGIPERSKAHPCPWVLLQESNTQSPCVCQLLCGGHSCGPVRCSPALQRGCSV